MFKIVVALFCVAVALSPVYLFPSGNPQPSDFIMAIAAATALVYALSTGSDMSLSRIPRSLTLLVTWVTGVSLVWAIVFSSSEFLLDPVFWIYNTIVSALVLTVLKHSKSAEAVVSWSLVVAMVISTGGVFLGLADPLGRITGFFNNPNQLAYFSVCATASLMVLNNYRVGALPVVLGFVMGAIGLLAAASLGAMAGAVSLVLALVVANMHRVSSFVTIPVGGIVVIGVLFLVNVAFQSVVLDTVEARLVRAETKIEDIYTERNYQRIAYFPEHNFLGAGSALHEERFVPYGRNEIHSSFGALLFNYGVIGLVLFLAYLYRVLHAATLPLLMTAAAPLIYSLTHMGLRFTIFWIFLAIILHKVREKRHRVGARCA